MSFFHILLLAIIQGLAELLPVSSSAHVIVAAKLLGLDPASPEMTLLLVMLHTGTMVAVIVYFWKAWRRAYFSSWAAFQRAAALVIGATAFTVLVGYPIKWAIEKIALRHVAHAEIEMIFGNLPLIAVALASAGVLILVSGLRANKSDGAVELSWRQALWIGAVQGLCLPFRGFSRSGSTISTGMLLRVEKARVEEFSFALAVVLTPPVVLREVKRLHDARAHGSFDWTHALAPGLVGLVLSFIAGLAALAWLSRWLEAGRWYLFGYYCLAAAGAVGVLAASGF